MHAQAPDMRLRYCISAGCLGALLSAAGPAAQPPAPSPQTKPRSLPTTQAKTSTGDFDVMLEKRVIRVLAPYSRTFFFIDRGRQTGYAADLVRVFEKFLNEKLAAKPGKRPLTVIIIPTTRDNLLQDVVNGLGDIAVGNLLVTDARKAVVDFVVAPDAIPQSEVVLTGPTSPVIATADDLSGKTVHVRPSSSSGLRLQGSPDRVEQTTNKGLGRFADVSRVRGAS
jgi:ABC-type amino acid transport substrate-binding protein